MHCPSHNYVFEAADLVDQFLARRFIDLNQGDGVTTGLGAAEIKGCYIDSGTTEQRSQCADQTQFVSIGKEQHVRLELGIHVNAFDPNDPRFVIK